MGHLAIAFYVYGLRVELNLKATQKLVINALYCNYPKLSQGSAKLRENLKPNEKPVEVKEETQDNIRQIKSVAGIVYSSMHKN